MGQKAKLYNFKIWYKEVVVFLFLLVDAILLRMDLQKRTIYKISISSKFDGLYFWNQWEFRDVMYHFKGLIDAKVDLEAQGRDSIFTFCHDLLI